MDNNATATTPVTGGSSSVRLSRIAGADASMRMLIQRMLDISCKGLPFMYRPEEKLFAFTRKRFNNAAPELAGTSLRYSAIVVLGSMYVDESGQRAILDGQSAREFCARLVDRLAVVNNLGDVALTTWAAADLGLPQLQQALARLRTLLTEQRECYTVELAWSLTALVAARKQAETRNEAAQVCDRLLQPFSLKSGIFPHYTRPEALPWYRSHVGCFADQVYPIQALARHYAAFEDRRSLDAASRCAEQICRLQGKGGQWWWHYNALTGEVIEGYPVYSVHQDAMGPMALLDLADAGGPDFADAIRLGVSWMGLAPEINRSLIDDELTLIWRKVARQEPGKLSRALRACASRVHPSLRLSWLNAIFPAKAVDYESRPYHLAWILHAWLGRL
jgi:hypothetical protein